MKIWIESSNDENFIVQNYVEKPAIENKALGMVTQYNKGKVFWTIGNNRNGYVDTIEEEKQVVEKLNNGFN